MDFVVQHAELRIETPEPAMPPDSEPVSQATAAAEPASPSTPVAHLSGDVHVREFTVWPSGVITRAT